MGRGRHGDQDGNVEGGWLGGSVLEGCGERQGRQGSEVVPFAWFQGDFFQLWDHQLGLLWSNDLDEFVAHGVPGCVEGKMGGVALFEGLDHGRDEKEGEDGC